MFITGGCTYRGVIVHEVCFLSQYRKTLDKYIFQIVPLKFRKSFVILATTHIFETSDFFVFSVNFQLIFNKF